MSSHHKKCDTYSAITQQQHTERIPLTRQGHKVRFDKRPLQPIPTRYLLRVWPLGALRYGDLTNLDLPGAASVVRENRFFARNYNLWVNPFRL